MGVGDALMEMVGPTLRMHEAYARELAGDLTEEQMDAAPGVGHENTPRFTVGHLCTGAALMRFVIERPGEDKTGRLDLPEAFQVHFQRKGPADRRLPSETGIGAREAGLTRDIVLDEFALQHQKLEAAVRAASDELLDSPCTWKLGYLLGRHSDLVMFVCSHEMLHLGQLASWRRAMGLPAAMARMIRE